MTTAFPLTPEDSKKIDHMKDMYAKYIDPVVMNDAATLKLIHPDLSLDKTQASFFA